VSPEPETRFSDLEAVKLAEAMEREGLDFYESAAEAAGGGDLADTFRMLAGEERKHLATFEDMAGELAKASSEDYWDDPDVDAYVRAVVSRKVFPRPEMAPGTTSEMSSAADALRFALQAEKDTVLYYSACAEAAKRNEVRKAFYDLIAEERKHVALMGRLLKEAGG
jgi:rubrerythrin